MTPILSILVDKDKEMHFYADGTFTGVPDNMKVANYIPLIIKRFQAIIKEVSGDYLPLKNGVTGSLGGSQEIKEYSDNKSAQSGIISEWK